MHSTGSKGKTLTNYICEYLILFKIRPSLTTTRCSAPGKWIHFTHFTEIRFIIGRCPFI